MTIAVDLVLFPTSRCIISSVVSLSLRLAMKLTIMMGLCFAVIINICFFVLIAMLIWLPAWLFNFSSKVHPAVNIITGARKVCYTDEISGLDLNAVGEWEARETYEETLEDFSDRILHWLGDSSADASAVGFGRKGGKIVPGTV